MEQPISSLTFSGSIPEAITEAKNQKKLFVVYISGEDEESIRLDEALWADSRVAECITKYCILLHIPEGTNDATNFSAIYPQKSSPCITAVGYTGVLLWQNDGLLNPENLVSSIEKAWLSLHIQETTASVLTAALSAKKNDQSLNRASIPATSSHESGESSSSTSPVPSEEHNKTSGSGQLPPESEMLDQANDGDHVLQTSEESPKQRGLKLDENQKSVSPSEAVGVREVTKESAAVDQDNREVSSKKGIDSSDNNMQESNYPSKSIKQGIKGDLHDEASEVMENRGSSSGVSDDTLLELLLNIRLPNGSNLKNKFPKIDALRLVKEYVDSNMADFSGYYDLAIPYPRKVFKDQDLDKSLAELGIINRQGLIVVPCQRARGSSSAPNASDIDSSTGRVGGYFSYVRKMLSYVNPFSYLGGAGSSTTTQESPSGSWQYSSNPATQNNTPRQGTQGFPNPTSTSSRNDGSIRRRNTSRIGANIHTLKHDDDDMYDDKNTYWNGNSTEFGGNDDNNK